MESTDLNIRTDKKVKAAAIYATFMNFPRVFRRLAKYFSDDWRQTNWIVGGIGGLAKSILCVLYPIGCILKGVI